MELAKSIEARKLNRRTGRPVDTLWLTVPFGAILENVVEKGALVEFSYLGELYHCRRGDIPAFLTAAPAAPGEVSAESLAADSREKSPEPCCNGRDSDRIMETYGGRVSLEDG